MKAIKYHGVQNIELVDIPKPEAGPGEVLVKIKYCGICGTDIHAYHHPGIFDWELILGHEMVGEVEAVGDGVDNVVVGDRVAVGPPGDCGECYACNTGHPNVCAHAFPNTLGIGPGTQGGYAEYVVSHNPKNDLFKIPEGMTYEQAVLFDVIGVGFHAVRRSELKVGDNAVVTGCGSIGLATIQSARLAGARNIVAFDLLESKRNAALAAGADYALDPSKEEDMQVAREVLSYEGGAAVSYECAGHPASVQTCIDCTMSGGQVILVGSDGRPFELITAALGPREYDLKFCFTYTKEEVRMLFDMIVKGQFSTEYYTVEKVALEKAEEKIIQLGKGEIDVTRVLLVPNKGEDN